MNRERRQWRGLFGKLDRRSGRAVLVVLFISTMALIFREHIPFLGSGIHRIDSADIELENAQTYQTVQSNGYIRPHDVGMHCKKHNWNPIETSVEPRKIYDLFMINSELDWLEIRLNELYNHVDYFVILEAPSTFTGLSKPLLFKENWKRFSKFAGKIIYHVLEVPSQAHTQSWNQWDHEKFQRNAMFTQILPSLKDKQAPREGDAILVSDLDEIPRPATLTLLRYCDFPQRLTLRSRFYYYGFQWLHRGAEWAHPQATTYAGPNSTILPQDLRGGHGASRFSPQKADLWNAAWHCSSCFSTLEEMLLKMQSFSHVEYNEKRYRERKRIVEYVRKGKDLWDRWGQWYVRVEGNEDVPGYLKANRQRFGYMLDRDGEGAGFVDYVPEEK